MKKIASWFLVLIMCFFGSVGSNAVSPSEEEIKAWEAEKDEPAVTVDASVAVDSELITYAKAVVLMEKSTGKVLYSENENEQLYPASVTKIMTILLVCEAIDAGKIKLTDTVPCSENAASKGGSQIWLEPGETMTVDELLKATCVYSANDACTLLGEYVSGSETAFVKAMNDRAVELGMKNTHFDNCTGLDDTTDTHLTTAYDIALMSCELLKHDFIKDYTTIWMDSLRNGETQLVNTNRLVRFYDGITGLKTGTTEKAGCCVSASAERNGMELVAVVMGSENSKDRFTSAQNMLDWGFANYEIVTPVLSESDLPSVPVLHGKVSNVRAEVPSLASVLVNKGQGSQIEVKTELPENLTAPVEAGQIIGTVRVFLGEKLVSEYELKAAEAVPELTFFSAMGKLLTSFTKK